MDDIEKYSGGWRIFGKSYDAIILACGEGAKWFKETCWLPVTTVRGQIIQVEDDGFADNLRCNVSYGGHISPDKDGHHTLGSTFQPWITHTEILEEDSDLIINTLKSSLIGAKNADFNTTYARAGLRTTSKDHFPIAGKVPVVQSWINGEDRYMDDLFLTTAHGSYGIVSTISAAHIIVDDLLGRTTALENKILSELSASRFLNRARRREKLTDLLAQTDRLS